jgi:hypothetical protein
MKSATKTFLEAHTPAAIADQQKRVKEQTAAQIADANLAGRRLLEHPATAEALADICLDLGYLGGWRGRVDDFNQGVLFGAHIVIDSLGPANKATILTLIAARAAKRINTTTK